VRNGSSSPIEVSAAIIVEDAPEILMKPSNATGVGSCSDPTWRSIGAIGVALLLEDDVCLKVK